jgi:hypothetical protein
VSVMLGSGEERSGVDVALQPVTTARVSGTLMSAAGPAATTLVRLSLRGPEEISQDPLGGVSLTDSAGAFIFPAVPPGQYTLRAFAAIGSTGRDPGSGFFWTSIPIAVTASDLDGLVVDLRQTLRIGGRVEFQGANPPQLSAAGGMALGITLDSVDGPPAADSGAMWNAGTFALFGFPGGRYLVRIGNSPAGWMFKSATLNGVDVSETPFDFSRDVSDLVITFTDRWNGVSGSIAGTGSDGASVIVFPIDAQSWSSPRRLKSARANAQGRFGISSLPPGDYYAVAIREEQAADWRDPKLLEELARVATRVSIGEGEHKMLDLLMKAVRH